MLLISKYLVMTYFRPEIIYAVKNYNLRKFLGDLTSGVIVGIVAFPLSIAFAIASGVSPERGLLTAAIGGFLISLLGGSRVQIAGPTGAFIVVLYGIVQQFGIEGLLMATFLAGVMMFLMGIFKVGSIIQYMPYPITIGFTSGIAVIIFTTQIKDFFGLSGGAMPADFIDKWIYYFSLAPSFNSYAIGVGLLTILLTIYGGRISKKIPGTLIAIVVGLGLVLVFDIPVETIGSKFGELSVKVPAPSVPWVSFSTFRLLLLPAFTIAMLGSIESLLSAMVSDGVTGHRNRPNTEMIAHGIANMVSPLFGGIPACGAVARTMTNVRNGGKTPIAGIVHALFILMILLFLGRWVKFIPMATLAGILFVVSYNMSEWRSFKAIFNNSKSEIAVLMTTFLLTVLVDISVAIQFGLVLAAFLFIKRVMETSDIEVLKHEVEDEVSHVSDSANEMLDIPKEVEIFQIKGPFFFGMASKMEEAETQIGSKPQVRIIRMRRVPFMDSTGLRNLNNFLKKSRNSGIHIIFSGLQPKPYELFVKNNMLELIGEENICPDIEHALERAREYIASQPNRSSRA